MNITNSFLIGFNSGYITYTSLSKRENKPQPPSANNVNFEGYRNILKTLWRNGELPTVKKGFYGDKLTQDNVSLEHLKPHSQGGRTDISNLVLASKEKNNGRGCKLLSKEINIKKAKEYLNQFIDQKAKNFNGNRYIKLVKKTLHELGIDI